MCCIFVNCKLVFRIKSSQCSVALTRRHDITTHGLQNSVKYDVMELSNCKSYIIITNRVANKHKNLLLIIFEKKLNHN